MPQITINISQTQLEQLLLQQDVHVETPAGPTYFELFEEQIRKLQTGGCLRTTETYRGAYKKFRQFLNSQDIALWRINSDLMDAYQIWLRAQGLALNTISFHLRILRAVYRKAVERGLATDSQPFRHVYTGMAKTAKRAISLGEIRRIKELQLDSRRLRFSRDMFLLSFYLRGMAFVDLGHLKKKDIRNGVLTYMRHKTGQQLCIRWERPMQEIVSRYPSRTGYLLPIITKENGKERNQYRNHQSKINEDLKVIARMARISQNLTMYCARHSWASIARDRNIPMSVISHGMGHTNEKTTEIYLKAIDMKAVDKANRKILDLLE